MLGRAMAKMRPRLYVSPGSHPCAAVEAALKLKSIDYDRVDLLPMSQILIGPLRYGGTTVPGLRAGGERLVGSRAIMRRLDELAPQPPLLPPPGDPSYARILEAERWGDEVLQSVPRRILDVAFLRRPDTMESYAGDAKLPLPRTLLRPALPLTARMMAIRNRARTPPRAPTSPPLKASSTASTDGSWRACSAQSGQTPPTCRSAARSGC
jgi:glutathione S-transferase